MSELKSRPYRGVQKEDRIAQRRQKLVESAIQLFGGQGFANTSIKALCVNAGLTERSFYESFGVKEELLQEAYLHASHVMLDAMRAAIAGAAPDIAARSLAAVREYFRQLHSDRCRARLVLFELEGISPATDKAVRQILDECTDLILEVLCAELPAIPRSGLDGRLLAIGCMGGTYQLAKMWVHGEYQLPEDDVARNAHALFVGAIYIWNKK